MNNLSNRTKGILFLVFSAFGFAVMSAFVKLAGDLPSFQKTFFRNLVSCIIALFFIIKNKESFFGKKENQKVLLLRSALGTVGIVLNFYSIDKLVLSDANMLNKLSPFFVIIFSALFLSEKINFKQFIAIIIAFVGTLFIIKPSFNLDMIPAFMGILGAIFAAGAYTCLRVLGGREKHYTIVFYFSLFSLVVIFPFMMVVYTPMSIKQLFYLLMAGVFASIGQFGITIAYKYAPAKEISIFDYSNILFSAMISFLVFGVLPDTLSFIGYFIIFASSYYMYIYNKKLDKAEGK
ncbi:DMT family transporter [Clostridium tertium]|jgi:drug/metabolite transporter (DMT)-like permease|uniref:DMT family transporter n=1 Tax=Clostridium TaxID=1485 RepID=UPI00115B36F6|nr:MULTISPECIES: DMT family transporter [Clostridium]MBS5305329.1 DMT family transporter [Clostridium sp.]MDB1924402.1 DMT family transporter [Clostridium tertium]MDB1927797.1 DMT family transporter [Clostridium tertium]MDB1931008.1 DMT family transporter [Clostridium tertium]MDB1934597.1 DMT family transporter [Clostridium tertium]